MQLRKELTFWKFFLLFLKKTNFFSFTPNKRHYTRLTLKASIVGVAPRESSCPSDGKGRNLSSSLLSSSPWGSSLSSELMTAFLTVDPLDEVLCTHSSSPSNSDKQDGGPCDTTGDATPLTGDATTDDRMGVVSLSRLKSCDKTVVSLVVQGVLSKGVWRSLSVKEVTLLGRSVVWQQI